jgi:hypothetical protein
MCHSPSHPAVLSHRKTALTVPPMIPSMSLPLVPRSELLPLCDLSYSFPTPNNATFGTCDNSDLLTSLIAP